MLYQVSGEEWDVEVARSYDGHPWEGLALSGSYAALSFDCSDGDATCTVTLPAGSEYRTERQVLGSSIYSVVEYSLVPHRATGARPLVYIV